MSLARATALSLRSLRREWRAGELRILAAALLIAVAGITSVGFFTDRIGRLMTDQAAEFLGADLVVYGTRAPDPALRSKAERLGLRTTATVSFASVVHAGGRLHLSEVKAVEGEYPLRGGLRIAPAPYQTDAPANGAVPPPGRAWIEPRLLSQLGLQVGDRVDVGAVSLTIDAVLTFEPDRGAGFISIAPRLLMNASDLPASQVIQPGSRVFHRVLLAGPEQPRDAFRDWVEPRLASHQRLITPKDASPELRAALDRGGRFLALSALVSVILAGVAVATAARRFASRHYDTSAILRCLGAPQRFVTRVFMLQLVWLGLAASLAGCLVGFATQEVLTGLLVELAGGKLPPPSLAPVAVGVATGFVALLGFGLPPLLRLKSVPPARVLRRDLEPPSTGNRLLYLLATASIVVLMLWHTRDTELTLWLLAGSASTLLVLYLLARLLVWSTALLRSRVGVSWRFGLANIARRAQGSVTQVLAFGLGIMVMLLLTVVRGDLLDGWSGRLQDGTPNHFLINIQPGEVDALRGALRAGALDDTELFPMVRGRLTALNGRAVSGDDYEEPRAKRLVDREFNLSWASTLQPDNRIVAGEWAGADPGGGLSVEQGLAETLGIRLGDRLRFQIADQTVEAPVTSLRRVDWDSFRVNFFVLFPPGALETMPATWITSFYLPPDRESLPGELVAQFPSITVIDVAAVMNQVRTIIDRVTLAVEYVFVFTLLAGLVVLYAAIQTTQDERLYEGAVVRVLGGQRRNLLQGLAAEFAILGLLAGLLAALAAAAVGWVLATQIFDLAYRHNPWLWFAGMGGGSLGVAIAGLLGARRVVSRPPMEVLRGG